MHQVCVHLLPAPVLSQTPSRTVQCISTRELPTCVWCAASTTFIFRTFPIDRSKRLDSASYT